MLFSSIPLVASLFEQTCFQYTYIIPKNDVSLTYLFPISFNILKEWRCKGVNFDDFISIKHQDPRRLADLRRKLTIASKSGLIRLKARYNGLVLSVKSDYSKLPSWTGPWRLVDWDVDDKAKIRVWSIFPWCRGKDTRREWWATEPGSEA